MLRRMTTVLGMLAVSAWTTSVVWTQSGPEEAPAGFDGESNGFITGLAYEEAKDEFTGPETIAEGLGPIFNGVGCGECHAVPVIGGSSQIFERRAGRFDGFTFVEHPGGSVIQDRGNDPAFIERVLNNQNVTALRSSLSVLGDGFVEAIDQDTLINIQQSQPFSMRGTIIFVPILEAPGRTRAGRFGWKNQHASLLSFAADAYKNEMGVTSPLEPQELTFNGTPFSASVDLTPDPEDDGDDVELFADFMRSTKVPPVDPVIAASPEAVAGSQLFGQIGCSTCHRRTIVTSPPGTIINGGRFKVPAALGNKAIHPFSDFLLHDIGTGDGIVQNGGQGTRNKMRTAPLWGLRTRGRLLHDGRSHNVNDAIQRHAGQATSARNSFNALSAADRNRVLTFLSSL